MEKRKASFTPIRKSSDEADCLIETATAEESVSPYATTGYTTSTSEDMKLQHATLDDKSDNEKSPIKEKKTASPTKILAPTTAQENIQISSDVISPMLDVECSTPERKNPQKCKGPSAKEDEPSEQEEKILSPKQDDAQQRPPDSSDEE